MEYIYSALLLHAAKKEVTEENVKKVLNAAGVAVDEAKVKSLISSLKEVNIEEAIKNASIPMAAPLASAAPAGEAKAEKKEEKKDEKKSEEEAAAGLASLFG